MIKFLIIRFSSIGDIVLTTPVLRIINEQIEESEIHFLTKENFKDVVKNNPRINKIHLLKKDNFAELVEGQYDIVFASNLYHILKPPERAQFREVFRLCSFRS